MEARLTVNEVAAIIVENYSKGSSHTVRDEVYFDLLKILLTGQDFGEAW